MACYVLLGLMLLLGNSCTDTECAKPADNLGTFTLTTSRIPAPTACDHNGNTLNSEADLGQSLADNGWIVEILIGGKCTGGGVWSQKFLKGEFSFVKKNNGDLQFTMNGVPYGDALSVSILIFSDCQDNSNGHCSQTVQSKYRAKFSGGFDKFTLTEQSKTRSLTITEERTVVAGSDSGCR